MSASDTTTPVEEHDSFLPRLQIIALSLLTFVLAVYILREFEVVLKPLFIAILIAYALSPVYQWLVVRKCPPLAAYLIISLGLMGLLAGVGSMVYLSIDKFSDRLPQYQKRVTVLNQELAETIRSIPFLEPEQTEHLITYSEQLIDNEIRNPQRWFTMLESAAGNFLVFLGLAVVVVFYLVFLLVEQRAFKRRIQGAFDVARSEEVLGVFVKINTSIAHYISVKTAMSAMTGLVTALILWLFGVEFAVMWGVIAFLANFIPYVGSFVAVLLPVAQSVVQPGIDSIWLSVLILLLLTGSQQLIGVLLEPMIAGRTLNVSPLLIVLSLAFWGFIWGVSGMILAVPILVVVKIALENAPATQSVGRLLSKV